MMQAELQQMTIARISLFMRRTSDRAERNRRARSASRRSSAHADRQARARPSRALAIHTVVTGQQRA
jgi:hypothetical protein